MREWTSQRSRSRLLLAAAETYAAHGLRVLPCNRDKTPMIRDWPRAASGERVQIAAWWGRWPDANIGLITGAPGYDILDVDVRSNGDGWSALRRLDDAGLLGGALGLVATPSGGRHLYFPASGSRSTAFGAHFLDFKAMGGYVLAPPSRGVGAADLPGYRWLDCADMGMAFSIESASAVLTPLRSRLPARRRGLGTSERGLISLVVGAPLGRRNDTLFYAANRLAERNIDPTILLDCAVAAGLSEEEAMTTIVSAVRTSAGRPS